MTTPRADLGKIFDSALMKSVVVVNDGELAMTTPRAEPMTSPAIYDLRKRHDAEMRHIAEGKPLTISREYVDLLLRDRAGLLATIDALKSSAATPDVTKVLKRNTYIACGNCQHDLRVGPCPWPLDPTGTTWAYPCPLHPTATQGDER